MIRNNQNDSIDLRDTMDGSLFAIWQVARDGYHITNDLTYIGDKIPMKHHETITDPPFIVQNSKRMSAYPLLGNKLLHRNLASVNHENENDLLKFVNQYGTLGDTIALVPPGTGVVTFGESLSKWKNLCNELGFLLTLWDLVEEKNVGSLGQFIIWETNPEKVLFSSCCTTETTSSGKVKYHLTKFNTENIGKIHCVKEALATREIRPKLLQRWKVGDVIEPALFYICLKINKYLNSKFSLSILPFMNNEIYTVPTSLEAAIWLLFAYEINGRIKPSVCPMCNDWFESDDPRQKFCSKACKQKAYRNRKGDT